MIFIVKYIEGMFKGFALLILFAIMIIIIDGCSGFGIDATQNRTIAITKPPYQIIYSGDLSEEDKKSVGNIVRELAKTDYKDYKFNEKIYLNVAGKETEVQIIPKTGEDHNVEDSTESKGN